MLCEAEVLCGLEFEDWGSACSTGPLIGCSTFKMDAALEQLSSAATGAQMPLQCLTARSLPSHPSAAGVEQCEALSALLHSNREVIARDIRLPLLLASVRGLLDKAVQVGSLRPVACSRTHTGGLKRQSTAGAPTSSALAAGDCARRVRAASAGCRQRRCCRPAVCLAPCALPGGDDRCGTQAAGRQRCSRGQAAHSSRRSRRRGGSLLESKLVSRLRTEALAAD